MESYAKHFSPFTIQAVQKKLLLVDQRRGWPTVKFTLNIPTRVLRRILVMDVKSYAKQVYDFFLLQKKKCFLFPALLCESLRTAKSFSQFERVVFGQSLFFVLDHTVLLLVRVPFARHAALHFDLLSYLP